MNKIEMLGFAAATFIVVIISIVLVTISKEFRNENTVLGGFHTLKEKSTNYILQEEDVYDPPFSFSDFVYMLWSNDGNPNFLGDVVVAPKVRTDFSGTEFDHDMGKLASREYAFYTFSESSSKLNGVPPASAKNNIDLVHKWLSYASGKANADRLYIKFVPYREPMPGTNGKIFTGYWKLYIK